VSARGDRQIAFVERDFEVAQFAEFLGATTSGDGRLALIEGPEGIGKTALLERVLLVGEDLGFTVLKARGSKLEMEFPYGIVRQLFERHVRELSKADRKRILHGAAKPAAPVVDDEPEPTDPPASSIDPFAVRHGLYRLAADLAQGQPLLLAVDDLHWADPWSERWIDYLARRLEGLPLAVIVTARTSEPETPGLVDDLEGDRHVLAPLSIDAVSALVKLGEPAADPEFCAACHRITDGNPFYVRELLSAAERAEIPATAGGAGQLSSLAPAPVAARVLARLRSHGPRAEQLAHALAVLGAGASSLRLAAQLAGTDEQSAAELIDELVHADLLGAERPFDFVHPIVRTAVYDSIPPAEGLRLHEAAVDLLASEAVDADRIAPHLLVTERRGDPKAVEILRAAAKVAESRGAPDLAARYLERALEETPGDDPELTHDLGLVQVADRVPAAFDHLRRGIELTPDRAQREEWSLELVRALGVAARPREAAEFAAQALTDGIDDPAVRLRIESELLAMAWLIPDMTPGAIGRLEQLDRSAVPEDLAPLVVLHRALRMTADAAPASDALALADRAFKSPLMLEDQSSLPFVVLITLIWNDNLDEPRRLCDLAMTVAQQMGSRHLTVNAGAFGGLAALRSGLLAESVELVKVSYQFALESAMPGSIDWAWALAILLDARRERDELAEGAKLLHEAGAEGELSTELTFLFLLESRGRLRCAQDRTKEGVADLLEAGRRWEQFRNINPSVSGWRSDAALALLRLGDRRRAVELADEELRLARQVGAARALGIALRAAAVVRGDEALLVEAVSTLESSPARLEYARALCELGAMRRHAGRTRDAREPLLAALDLARRCTAAPLAKRALDELALIGTRPRRQYLQGVESLTPGELRTARLAAEGNTNKEIAQALYVTLRTVETHLTHAYRKLDITSRSELGGALGSPETTA
jgi:DNA-binding CsgD family transcriptional regulator